MRAVGATMSYRAYARGRLAVLDGVDALAGHAGGAGGRGRLAVLGGVGALAGRTGDVGGRGERADVVPRRWARSMRWR